MPQVLISKFWASFLFERWNTEILESNSNKPINYSIWCFFYNYAYDSSQFFSLILTVFMISFDELLKNCALSFGPIQYESYFHYYFYFYFIRMASNDPIKMFNLLRKSSAILPTSCNKTHRHSTFQLVVGWLDLSATSVYQKLNKFHAFVVQWLWFDCNSSDFIELVAFPPQLIHNFYRFFFLLLLQSISSWKVRNLNNKTEATQ